MDAVHDELFPLGKTGGLIEAQDHAGGPGVYTLTVSAG